MINVIHSLLVDQCGFSFPLPPPFSLSPVKYLSKIGKARNRLVPCRLRVSHAVLASSRDLLKPTLVTKKSLKLHQVEILSMACEPLFLQSNRKFSLAHLVSLEKTLGSPLEFQVELCGFEQCLAPQDEIEMNDATAGKWGLRG